jgi:hypothetical protein
MAASSSSVQKYTPSMFDRLLDNDLINSKLFNVRQSSYLPSESYLHFFRDSLGKLSCFSYFPPVTTNESRMVVVYFHGNSCDIGDCEEKMRAYAVWLDLTIICLEYSGYGCCVGETTQAAVIQKAIDSIIYISEKLNIPFYRIILFGHSIGCAIAMKINTHFEGKFAAVILQSPFFNVKKMAETSSIFSFFLGEKSVFNNAEEIKQMAKHQRLLIIHGAKDEIIHVSQGRQLFDMSTLPASQKTMLIDPMASHNVFDKIKLRFEIILPFTREVLNICYKEGRDVLLKFYPDLLISKERHHCKDVETIRRIIKPIRQPDKLAWIGADGNCCFDIVNEADLHRKRGEQSYEDGVFMLFES